MSLSLSLSYKIYAISLIFNLLIIYYLKEMEINCLTHDEFSLSLSAVMLFKILFTYLTTYVQLNMCVCVFISFTEELLYAFLLWYMHIAVSKQHRGRLIDFLHFLIAPDSTWNWKQWKLLLDKLLHRHKKVFKIFELIFFSYTLLDFFSQLVIENHFFKNKNNVM